MRGIKTGPYHCSDDPLFRQCKIELNPQIHGLTRCIHRHYTVKKKVELYTKNGGSSAATNIGVTFTLYMRCDITLH